MLNLKKSPLSGLSEVLAENMSPKGSIPTGLMVAKKKETQEDTHMVLNKLRAINRMSLILQEVACGCEPLPSWAEAKIYNASAQLESVLGYSLGRE